MAMQELMMSALKGEEIHNLDLNEDGYYIKVFVINDKQNRAADPEPFKINPKALEPIAASIVGRPFIVGPDATKHVRGATGRANEILQVQKKWSVGEFVKSMMNPLSRNVYGIARIFPEFVKDLKKGFVRGRPLPKYSSPLVEVRRFGASGEITDGRILHVQAVDIPGYGPEVAKIVGTCDGMLNECMSELRHLGAAGKLKAYQASILGASSYDDELDIFEDFDEKVRRMFTDSGGPEEQDFVEIWNNVRKRFGFRD
jgi:hypothetical protein